MTNNIDTFKLAIFDLDDTLLKSHLDYKLLKNKINENIDSVDIKRKLATSSILESLELLKKLDEKKYLQIYSEITDIEIQSTKNAELIPNADRVIAELLNDEKRIGILTNNSRGAIEEYKKRFSFLTKLEILTRDDVEIPKPNPDGINKLLEQFNISNDETIYFGDSWLDSCAAYEANVRFIWFRSRKEVDVSLFPRKPWKIFDNWKEFLRLI